MDMSAFLASNPSLKFQAANLFDESVISKLQWPAGINPSEALFELRAIQALSRLTGDQKAVESLYQTGMHSALQITAISQDQFLNTYGEHFTGGKAAAKQCYQTAMARRTKLSLTYMAIRQHTQAHYRATRFDNLSKLTDQQFQSLPNYPELFGGLDFCTCSDCRSIFSPAAYFTDLMRIQACYIHPTTLETRRPDLSTFTLDCENTNTMMPKLTIVNEVLVQTIGKKDQDLKYLNDFVYPFNLPFHLPFSSIQTYLASHKMSLDTLWSSLNSPKAPIDPQKIALATLNIPGSQADILYDSVIDDEILHSFYGLDKEADLIKSLENVDDFLRITGLDATQLQDLFYEDLSKDEFAQYQPYFFINSASPDIAAMTIKDGMIEHLTIPRIDHIHRFIRLAEKLNWSFTDLDWALRIIHNSTSSQVFGISPETIPYLAWMKSLEKNHRLSKVFSINWVGTLLDSIKWYGKKDGSTFFASIFNSPRVPNPPTWSEDLTWEVPLPNTVQSPTSAQIQAALTAALQVSATDLLLMANTLLNLYSPSSRILSLRDRYLSLFLRLSQLPLLTGISISENLILADLLGEDFLAQLLSTDVPTTITALNTLTSLSEWLTSKNLSAYRLQYWLTGNSDDKKIRNAIFHTDTINNFKNSVRSALNATQCGSTQLSSAMNTSLLSLKASFSKMWELLTTLDTGIIDAAGLIIRDPAGTDVLLELGDILKKAGGTDEKLLNSTAALLQTTLLYFQELQQTTLYAHLASLCNITTDMVAPLVSWVYLMIHQFEENMAANPIRAEVFFMQPLWAQVHSSTDTDQLVIQLQLMQRLADWVKTTKLSSAELKNIQNPNTAPCYGIVYSSTPDDISWLNLSIIQNVYAFKDLVVFLKDTQNKLINYLSGAVPPAPPQDNSSLAKEIAELFSAHEEDILCLLNNLWPASTSQEYASITGLSLIKSYLSTHVILGVTISGLLQLMALGQSDQTYEIWNLRSAAVWSGLQQVYQDQPNILQGLQGQILELTRDALLTRTLFQLKKPSILTARDLYDYLLIDPEISSVVMTSRVVEAISAVQLYVYRCLNNLEENTHADPELGEYWEWLSQYRVWQANREVFIYPENYIEPELRRSVTPIFSQLENGLKQTDLTNPAKVENLLKEYLNDFETIANLAYVGANTCDRIDNNKHQIRTLCVIGRTLQQPYSYYYRTVDFLFVPASDENDLTQGYTPVQWNPWLPMNVQIKATADVSPLYAYGRWYAFWVETSQNGEKSTTTMTTGNPQYQDSICFSYLDCNANWTSAQILASRDISKKANNQEIYPVYCRAIATILVPYYNPNEVETLTFPYGLNANGPVTDFSNITYLRFWTYNTPNWHLPPALADDKFFSKDEQNIFYCYRRTQAPGSKLDYSLRFKTNGSASFWVSFVTPQSGDLTYIAGFFVPADGMNSYRCVSGLAIDDQRALRLHVTGGTNITLSTNLIPGRWYLLAVEKNPEATLEFYLNGEKVGSQDGFSNTEVTTVLSFDYNKGAYSNSNLASFQEIFFDEGNGYSQKNKDYFKTLYDSNINFMQDYASTVNLSDAFTLYPSEGSIGLPIVNQPNWRILQNCGERILELPKQSSTGEHLACFRLNSTAVVNLIEILFTKNISGLLATSSQTLPELDFSLLGPVSTFIPENGGKVTYRPSNKIDFYSGALSEYYWELFFHAPFLIANALQNYQQFQSAKNWYQYVFNPTFQASDSTSNPDDYWCFEGLKSSYNTILSIELHEAWSTEISNDVKDQLQLYQYHNDPFDPHAIAALRPIAYQKTIVMHYINNLLQWADQLYQQYTRESLVEATMLYIMAYDLLGTQPRNVGACPLPPALDLTDLVSQAAGGKLNSLSEFLIILDQKIGSFGASMISGSETPNNYIDHAYFGLPENLQLLNYWDILKQRLYNLRHGLNIEGVQEVLALFQPPINPMALVEALASGEGLSQAVSSLQAEVPYYRFNVIVEKAKESAQLVIQFGQSLLSALEKKDAEQLALLYNTQQQQILALTQTNQEDQLAAATQRIASLQASLQNAQIRVNYYTALLAQGLSAGELAQQTLDKTAMALQISAQSVKLTATGLYLLPTIFGLADGGINPGEAMSTGSAIMEGSANALSMAAGLAGTMAGYQRRAQDWELQLSLAQSDVQQITYQIAAANAEKDIALQAIVILNTQISQQQNIAQFLKSKFTNAQLYQWMIGKLSTVYYQAYQLAYDYSIMAQEAWQFERCEDNKTFINENTYWSSTYQGLTAGESLLLDLERMQSAYMKKDQRLFEIEKIISLAQWDPTALAQLKDEQSNYQCNFDFTEKMFSDDYPKQSCRQIKTISLTFPMILGPYQTLHATLTQTKNTVYLANGKSRPDLRANQQVALSQGVNDDGLFSLNFNDERYLPFEGTGVESSWKLDMGNNIPALDTLTDVIIRIKYTAFPLRENTINQASPTPGHYYRTYPLAEYAASGWENFLQKQTPLLFNLHTSQLRSGSSACEITELSWQLMRKTPSASIQHLPGTTLYLTQENGSSEALKLFWQVRHNGNLEATISLPTPMVMSKTSLALKLVIDSDPDQIFTASGCNNLLLMVNYQEKIPQKQ